ncbi:hypothetical protein [Arthrobacter sp. NPDC056727]|uniref:hypothetical protein n=1 Tax=Arthrobacter sp. NPDC056727 TaxID=3345927 RepID=UPI00366D3180
MTRETVLMPIFALALTGIGGAFLAVYIGKRLGRFLNFRSLLILNYILVSNVSGIVHLMEPGGASRGYFDVLSARSSDVVESATISSLLGLAAVCVGCMSGITTVSSLVPQSRPGEWLLSSERKSLWLLVAVLLPLSVFSIIQIQQYVQSLDASRIIQVADGYARYSFMSGWFVWAATFTAICLVSGRLGTNRLFVLCVSSGALIAIVASLAWSGGRSVIVVMTFPLALVLLPKLRGVRWLAIPAATAAAASYIIAVTETRTVGAASQLWTWLDWEWGRFSMLGFADQYAEEHGFLWGETFVAGVTNILFGSLRLIGIGISNPPLRSSMNITGEELLNSSTAIYIVPGLGAELFMSFGVLGVVLGFYLLGRLVSFVDRKYIETSGAIPRILWAYIGTLLVFRTIAADSGSIYSYVLYTGFPLLIIAVFSSRIRSRESIPRIV